MSEKVYTEEQVARLQAAEAKLVLEEFLNDFREEFLKALTEDSETQDRRRKDFNQAIFDGERGFACFNGTDLSMVMEKFDKAVKNLGRRP